MQFSMNMEDEDHDVTDEGIIMDQNIGLGQELVDLPQYKDPGITSVDFNGLLKPPLLLYEDAAKGCGGHTWPAGMVMAKYLLREPQLDSLRGKRILELGAGSGLVGLAIAQALSSLHSSPSGESCHIQITDQAPMMSLMQKNISLNAISDDFVSAEILDWGEPIAQHPPDVILAAECVYFEPAFPLLLQTLSEMIGRNTLCYFCFKKRRRADMRFIKDAKKKFVVHEVLDDPDRSIWSRENLFL